MTDTTALLQAALDALEHPHSGLVPHNGYWMSRTSIAIDAIRAHLAQPQSEPDSGCLSCVTCGAPAAPAPAVPDITDEREKFDTWFRARTAGLIGPSATDEIAHMYEYWTGWKAGIAAATAVSAAENAALQARVDTLLNDIHSCGPTCQRAGCVNAVLRAEVAGLRAQLKGLD